ncbi:hypothetical protein CHS0354_033778 [Potamilus streckersoni]|uniref:Uncharacterized protein n=1 Tax=Potamilus streckersoni TaxID=2493646 RepID=A0AAE0VN37_9BIVA|nr:hypothetical protein CHS0354_033778 [Potamilus streckersoni]
MCNPRQILQVSLLVLNVFIIEKNISRQWSFRLTEVSALKSFLKIVLQDILHYLLGKGIVFRNLQLYNKKRCRNESIAKEVRTLENPRVNETAYHITKQKEDQLFRIESCPYDVKTAMQNVFFLLEMNVKKEGTYVNRFMANNMEKAEWYYLMSICKNKTRSFSKMVLTELYKSFSLLKSSIRDFRFLCTTILEAD